MIRQHTPSMGVIQAERKMNPRQRRKQWLRVLAADIRARRQLTPWSQDAHDILLRQRVDGQRHTRNFRIAERLIDWQDRVLARRQTDTPRPVSKGVEQAEGKVA